VCARLSRLSKPSRGFAERRLTQEVSSSATELARLEALRLSIDPDDLDGTLERHREVNAASLIRKIPTPEPESHAQGASEHETTTRSTSTALQSPIKRILEERRASEKNASRFPDQGLYQSMVRSVRQPGHVFPQGFVSAIKQGKLAQERRTLIEQHVENVDTLSEEDNWADQMRVLRSTRALIKNKTSKLTDFPRMIMEHRAQSIPPKPFEPSYDRPEPWHRRDRSGPNMLER